MRKLYLLILLLILFSSCSTQSESASSPASQPILASEENLPLVTGKILLNSKPVAGEIVFLGTVLSDPVSGEELAVSLDKSNAPKSITDDSGNFFFTNVPNGRYGLMLISGVESFLLLHPNTQEAILLKEKKKTTYDLGSLNYKDLPIE